MEEPKRLIKASVAIEIRSLGYVDVVCNDRYNMLGTRRSVPRLRRTAAQLTGQKRPEERRGKATDPVLVGAKRRGDGHRLRAFGVGVFNDNSLQRLRDLKKCSSLSNGGRYCSSHVTVAPSGRWAVHPLKSEEPRHLAKTAPGMLFAW